MASAFFLPVPAFLLLAVVSFNRRGVPAGYSRIAAGLFFISQLATSALLLTAALGYAGSREFGFYLCAVLLMLFLTSLFFVRLLITSFRTSQSAA